MKILLYLLLASLIISCNTATDKQMDKAPGDVKKTESSAPQCFRFASATDTVRLKIIPAGDSISGTLVYQLKEKDRNTGTITGRMENDLLIADYTFMSEGTESTRPVVFKKEGSAFVEGYGDLNKPGSLDYSHSFKLIEINCAD